MLGEWAWRIAQSEKNPAGAGFFRTYFFFFLAAVFFFTGFFLAAMGFTPGSIDNKRLLSVLQTVQEKHAP
jgi:hypothetical protein